MCHCDVDGHSEFYNITYPKARKSHWCMECHIDILPGTQYARHTQKWEGEVESTAFCDVCDAWATALQAAQHAACGCSGWTYGCMWNVIGEFTDEHLGYDHKTGEPRQTEKQYREEQEARRRKYATIVMTDDNNPPTI